MLLLPSTSHNKATEKWDAHKSAPFEAVFYYSEKRTYVSKNEHRGNCTFLFYIGAGD